MVQKLSKEPFLYLIATDLVNRTIIHGVIEGIQADIAQNGHWVVLNDLLHRNAQVVRKAL